MNAESTEVQPRLRILVVEDDPLLRRYLAGAFATEAEVEVAADIDTALAKIDAGAFDAVLTDYELKPGLGTSLLAHVRASHPATRRYLMSADDLAARGGVDCCDGFFLKPFDFRAVLATIRVGVSSGEARG